jgi:hypothetical protein
LNASRKCSTSVKNSASSLSWSMDGDDIQVFL